MGLETGSTISSFITSNPTSSDPVNQGDDHLRLIKSVLQAQFPGVGGLGYATAITTTEAELNALHGFTNIGFASGTRVPFAQAAAPTGWTQDTTDIATDRMLRVINTAGGGVAGTDSPIVNSTTMVAHSHTFTGSALAPHTHTDAGHTHSAPVTFNGFQVNFANSGAQGTGATGIGYAVISSNSAGTPAGTNSTTTGVSWVPRYIDMIICAKN